MKVLLSMTVACVCVLASAEAFAQEDAPRVTFVPTGGLSINMFFEDSPSDDVAAEDTGYVYPSLWLGVRALEGPDLEESTANFAAFGFEVEPHSLWDGRSATYIIPTLRLGVAWVPEADWGLDDWRNPTYVPFHAYGSLGVRSRSLTNAWALRLGVGLNLLLLPLGMGLMCEVELESPVRCGVNWSMGF